MAVVVALGAAGQASAATRATFVQGEQNVVAVRPGDGLEATMRALLAGPTPAERGRQIRTYIPAGTPLLGVSQEGPVATVDFGRRLVDGDDGDAILARLSQVVGSATSVPGVRSVRVLIEGGVPLGLFPGVNATVPLSPSILRTPDVRPPAPTRTPDQKPTNSVRDAQQRLADLGYLLPGDVDGQAGPGTAAAVTAFQKWEGLGRDGVLGPRTLARLRAASRPTPRTAGASGRRVEVLIDRQLALAIEGGRVVRALHVSTGKPSTPTPTGSYTVYAQFPRWWSTPFREWLLWASPFVGGVALHQFPDVPVYAASHGCVRVPEANARWLFTFVSVGTPVRVIASSR